jgi:signal peptidase I
MYGILPMRNGYNNILEIDMRRKSGLQFGKQRKKLNLPLAKEILAWIVQIAIVIFVAYFVVNFWGGSTTVVGQAMEDNLENNDQILLDKFTYVLTNPQPGDVIVFLPNGNDKSHYYVRRVIAVPGDKVQIIDGAIYVNGERFDEKVTVASMQDAGLAKEEITLGNGVYFVLGDNRNDSEDSRHANIGNVKKEYIIGKAWYKFNSLKDHGFVH